MYSNRKTHSTEKDIILALFILFCTSEHSVPSHISLSSLAAVFSPTELFFSTSCYPADAYQPIGLQNRSPWNSTASRSSSLVSRIHFLSSSTMSRTAFQAACAYAQKAPTGTAPKYSTVPHTQNTFSAPRSLLTVVHKHVITLTDKCVTTDSTTLQILSVFWPSGRISSVLRPW